MKGTPFRWLAPSLTTFGTRFGIDAHYFAKNGAAITFAHGIAVIKGIVTGYLVTRMFPQEMYGEYRFVLNVAGFVGFVGIPGLPSALGGAIARKEQVSLRAITQWLAVFLSIGTILLLGCLLLLPTWGRQDLWPLFAMSALLFVPSTLGINIFGGVIRGTGEFTRAVSASFIANILVMIAVLIMLYVHPSSLLLLTITTGIPALVYMSQLIPLEKRFRSTASQKSIKKTAIHLSVATIPSNISWYIDGLLISAFFGLNQLALFSVALLIPEQVKLWAKELLPLLFAKQASGKDTAERRMKLHKAVLIGTGIFAIGIAIYAALAPWLIPILFPRYEAAELVPLTIGAAIVLITTPAAFYPQFLEARGMVRSVHIANWVSSAVFVIALVSLIPTWGALGAIIARGIMRLTYGLVSLIMILRTPVEAD